MNLQLLGLGTAVGGHEMSQADAAQLAVEVCCRDEQQARVVNVLYRRSGVRKRHICVPYQLAFDYLPSRDASESALATEVTLGPTTGERMVWYREHAGPLAVSAAAQALEASGVPPTQITHLVTVSCTGFAAPGVDVALIQGLGLAATVERANIGFMGCHGAINGLRVASALAASRPEARVLLCAVELCSLHYSFAWDPERMVGNALFADGAAAIVGKAAADGPANSNGSPSPWRMAATGSCLLPDALDAMTWQVGDHGFEMTLSPRVPELIGTHLPSWISSWLATHGLSIEQIRTWGVHPGGPRIVNAVAECLGLSDQATAISREVLSELGNMSSPTVLFILERLLATDAERPAVMLAFGPGLVAEAALWT